MYDIVISRDNEIQKAASKLGINKLIIFQSKNKSPEVHTSGKLIISKFSSTSNFKSNLLYGIESVSFRDGMHQRYSGLNHIICKTLANKDIIVCFSFCEILNAAAKRSKLMGRISQNIRLLRKYKVKMVFASLATKPIELRYPKDLASLYKCLGFLDKEIKASQIILKALYSNSTK